MDNRDRKNRRTTTLRVGIAALALLGIGAAVTTAAWTDQAWFSAEANAATFDLQGSASNTGGWQDYDTQAGALVIPVDASNFGEIVPGTTPLTLDVYVKNNSSVEANLNIVTKGNGTLFDGAGSTVTVTADADVTPVAPGDIATITISLTPGAMPESLQGATGTVLVTVTGATS